MTNGSNKNLAPVPITKEFFIEYMDDFSISLAKQFDSIDRKFEKIDQRFEQIDKRFEQIDKRFEQIDKRFEKIEKRLDAAEYRLSVIEKDIADIKDRLKRLDRRTDEDDMALFSDIEKTNKKLSTLEKRVILLENKVGKS